VATIRERISAGGKRAFHVQVRMTGFPARTASFPTKRAAERWATTIEADMIEGKRFRSVEARRRTLADAIDRYIADELPKKRHAGMHQSALAWWKAELGHLKLADITPAKLVEFRDKLAKSSYQRARPDGVRSKFKDKPVPEYRRSRGTVNRFLACLSHVFSIARREWHWIGSNPVEDVSRLTESSGRLRHLSDDERKALLAETAKDKLLHAFVLIALSTACRAGELRKLAWVDVDLRRGDLLFRETKNAQPRAVSLHGEALRLLKAHAKVRRLGGDLVFEGAKGGQYDYRKPFLAAVARAGLDNFHFHDLRHSAATYLAQMGATEQQLRAIGGWKSNVVNRYVHLAAEDARAALEKLAEKVQS
jgi:integrase